MNSDSIERGIKIRGVAKSFENRTIQALSGVDLEIKPQDFVAIMGPSGCGKSTLLNMVSGLDKPDNGEIIVNGEDLGKIKDLASFRRQNLGFVFQLHNLIPTLTALENVEIPMYWLKMKGGEKSKKARGLLQMVGLVDRFNSSVNKLSGGERQRVAVARALSCDPKILIADEPTGALDSQSAHEVLELIKEIHEKSGNITIMVTHDQGVARFADRIIKMRDGRIEMLSFG